MANMSYCRFENTMNALQDCYENGIDADLSDSEKEYRYCLVELCKSIVAEYGDGNTCE